MFILISAIVVTVSALLFSRVAGSLALTKLNMITWVFYFQLILQSFIASLLVISGLDNHYVINRVQWDARLQGWFAVQYTMIAMPLGMMAVVYLHGLRSNRRVFDDYIRAPMTGSLSGKDSFLRIPLYVLSLASILSTVYTFYVIGGIPLLAMLKGADALTLAIARVEASLGFSGNVYFRNLFGYTLAPILAYISFGFFRLTGSLADRLWFYVMSVTAFFMLTYDLSKAPVVVFVLGFLFFNVLTNGGVRKRTIYMFGAVVFLLLVLSYAYIAQVVDPKELFSYNSGITGRIILSQAAGTYFSFEHFPRSHDFIGLASVSNVLSGLLGYEASDRSSRIIMTIFNPSGVEQGSVAVMNSLFIAEAWANFGWLGVLVAPIYVGIFIQFLFMFFIRSAKTPVKLGIFVYLSLTLPVTGGFNDFFYAPGLAVVAFIFVHVYLAGVLIMAARRKALLGSACRGSAVGV